jgi:hypothetical protein
MEIITSLPRYSDGEVNRALIREITTGIQLKYNLENEREKICAKHAQEVKKNQEFGFKSLRCVSVTPAWEWFNMRKKYGHDEIHSRGFIKNYQKRFPHLSPNKL